VLLALALALMLAQVISAVLLWRAQADRREAALVHAAALRLFAATREGAGHALQGQHPPEFIERAQHLRIGFSSAPPLIQDDQRIPHAEQELREILGDQGVTLSQVRVAHLPFGAANFYPKYHRAGANPPGDHRSPRQLLVVAIQPRGGMNWLVVAMPVPRDEPALLMTLLGQTLLLYVVLVGAAALILRRITHPLAALTNRLDQFAVTRDSARQLVPQGPDDVRCLILAHNAMEDRIIALLNEKDLMLGAIGHDLKTPLATLRVRIESVEDEHERAKMASTIEDIARSLDDILSLVRVGRPSDPTEPVELAALIGQVAEEYEDLGQPVSFAPTQRLVARLRVTWLRRALRNLVSNALRYGQVARIALIEAGARAVIEVEDDGPGIAEDQIARMFDPFIRGEPSRNSETGGAGLGLTLARAIAAQHGGTLNLANRRAVDGSVTGLTATLILPL